VELESPIAAMEGRRENMLALLSQVERFTFTPKFQVNSEAMLIAQFGAPAGSRKHPRRRSTALSLVIDRIAPDAPAQPKEVRVITSGPQCTAGDRWMRSV